MRMLSTFTIIFLLFSGWILITPSPAERINKACAPIIWAGEIVESVAMFSGAGLADSVRESSRSIDYGCRFTVWRFFYEKDWAEQQERLNRERTGKDNEGHIDPIAEVEQGNEW